MQFNDFTLTNFGVFRGPNNTLHLTPPSTDRSVVLVGALNGSGKTTIIEAFQLALYGKRSRFGRRSKKSSYDDYLRSIRNRQANAKEPTSLELIFTVPEDGKKKQFRIKRSWLFDTAKPKEFFQVFVDGSPDPDPILSQTWQDEVERYLPRRLADLFFFDGERVETLADPESSAEVLRTAISSLLGLDVVDRCKTDLLISSERVNKESADAEQQEHLDGLESRMRDLRSEIDKNRQEAASLSTNDIPIIEKRLATAQSRFEAVGGGLFQERGALQDRLIETKAKQADLQQGLIMMAQGGLPLSLVKAQLKRIQAADTTQRNLADEDRRAEIVRSYGDNLLKWLDKQNVARKTHEAIKLYVKNSMPGSSTSGRDQDTFQFSDSERQNLAHLLDSHFIAVGQQATELCDKYAETLLEMESLQTVLSKVPDESHVAKLLDDIAAQEQQLVAARQQLSDRDDRIRSLESEMELIRKERLACFEIILLAKEAKRYTEYAQRSIESLNRFRESLLSKNISKLEAAILEAFQLLIRKDSLVKHLRIDPESMAVTLTDPDGNEVDPSQLSAGERQLLAISVLWGLAKASKLDIPVVIDTPLGRLDGKHRTNLINSYFPQASHQVILLSTDMEVDESAADQMKDSVGHKYLIDYREEKTGSFIEKGYFGEIKRA